MPRSTLCLLALLLTLGCSAPAALEPAASQSPSPQAEPTPGIRLQGAYLFFEDFERGLDRWTVEGDLAGVRWHRLNANTCGGAWVMLFGRIDLAPFEQGQGALAMKQPLDLTGAKRPHLIYEVMGTATPDSGLTLQPEARRPGEPWQAVGTPARARYRFGFSRFADLTAYAGGKVELRFRVEAGSLDRPTTGMYLDQVQVVEPAAS